MHTQQINQASLTQLRKRDCNLFVYWRKNGGADDGQWFPPKNTFFPLYFLEENHRREELQMGFDSTNEQRAASHIITAMEFSFFHFPLPALANEAVFTFSLSKTCKQSTFNKTCWIIALPFPSARRYRTVGTNLDD